MASFWHVIGGPEALYWAPRHLVKLWNVKNIYITENGCGAADEPAADGIVYDSDRIMFLRNYLTQCSVRRPRACRCEAISIGARWTTSSGPAATAPASD